MAETGQVARVEEEGRVALVRLPVVDRVCCRHLAEFFAHPAQWLARQLCQPELPPKRGAIQRMIALGFWTALCHTGSPLAFIAASARVAPVDRPESDALVDFP